jgi:hypothetical protein
MQIDRKEPAPLNGDIPKSVYGCLGSRFRVAIDRSGDQKLYMLFALQGDDWKLCQTGLPPH